MSNAPTGNTQYQTRSMTKAMALFHALVMAGYQTQLLSCHGHIHMVTAADAAQFAAVRASIGIPSSIDKAVAAVEIPDDISSLDAS